MNVLDLIVLYLPTVIAIAAEAGLFTLFKKVLEGFKKTKESKEYLEMKAQNQLLLEELREAKRLNKELLTKIDRISRGE